ncbi:hypothetical protein ACFLWV_00525 [Chloroflexota bacterium]
MPSLRHLLDELNKLRVEPDEVRMPGQVYDDIVDQAEDSIDEED